MIVHMLSGYLTFLFKVYFLIDLRINFLDNSENAICVTLNTFLYLLEILIVWLDRKAKRFVLQIGHVLLKCGLRLIRKNRYK